MTATTTPRRTPATPAARPKPGRAVRLASDAAFLWLACSAAMAAGLWADTLRTPAALLASQCAAPGGLLEQAWRHAALMPASSTAMLIAALLPLPGAPRMAARLACALTMGLGMLAGAQWGMAAALAAGAAPFGGMAAGMALGMAAAMAAGALIAGASAALR
ncbi:MULTISPECIES: hypothetical protein [Achromobacter]|uniref:hypothetical protein n=1 Tax=Achromobacter sp. SD115 TaxID=2782011 RepID=UPI001F60F3F9|nr:hypothetical protein [Achromobacter sp. SD115]